MEEQVAKLVSRFFHETERNGEKGQFGFPFPKLQLTVWSVVPRVVVVALLHYSPSASAQTKLNREWDTTTLHYNIGQDHNYLRMTGYE